MGRGKRTMGRGRRKENLMDGDTVLGPHFVKLVDANNSIIGENHGAALQVEVAVRVPDYGRRQPRRTASLARRVHCYGRLCLHRATVEGHGFIQSLSFGSVPQLWFGPSAFIQSLSFDSVP